MDNLTGEVTYTTKELELVNAFEEANGMEVPNVIMNRRLGLETLIYVKRVVSKARSV